MIKNFQFLKGKKWYKCVCNKEVSIFISKAVININSDEKIKTTIQTVISSNTKQEGNRCIVVVVRITSVIRIK